VFWALADLWVAQFYENWRANYGFRLPRGGFEAENGIGNGKMAWQMPFCRMPGRSGPREEDGWTGCGKRPDIEAAKPKKHTSGPKGRLILLRLYLG